MAARDPFSGVKPQTQSSLAVSADGKSWALLNASPDIRQQIEHNSQLHPRALRDTPIASVLVTNGDIDHIAGLLVLREKQAFDLIATAALQGVIETNTMFRALDPEFVRRRTVALEETFTLVEGIEARLFAVPGKVPLFLEDGEPDTKLEGEQTVGVEMLCGDIRAYYIPGCGAMTDKLAARLRGADLVFFDGTVFRDNEMITTGTSRKTGRRMGHMAMEGPDGSVAALGGLDIGRRIFVHINNTNPVWQAGSERALVEEAGFEIAQDGVEVVL